MRTGFVLTFPPAIRQEALVKSKRHCCICQEFAGRSTEVHHIVPEADGGSNELENTIVLCLRCHAEAGHYNPKHPIGNKYSPKELRRLRDAWWRWCAENPATIPPKSPIIITPISIGLVTSEWTQKTMVVIQNRSGRPLFHIWVKASILGPLSFSEHVEITPSVSAYAPSVSCGDLTLSGSILRFIGNDSLGNTAQLFRLYEMDAGKTCKFTVVCNTQKAADECSIELRFALIEFSEEPPSLMERQDGSALGMGFTCPEDFIVRKVSFYAEKVGGGNGT